MSDRKKLFENFLSLTVLQGVNYILPILTLPYLVRVLGPDKYGVLAFAQALIQYFVILTDYGFNLSATKEISIHRNDKEKVSNIFSTVVSIKLILMLFSFIILFSLVMFLPKFNVYWELYLLYYGMIIGNVFIPVWFFQGIEKMKYSSVLNVLAKLFFTLSIFVLVKDESDFMLVPLLNTLGFIVSGILSMVLVFGYFKVKFVRPTYQNLKEQLSKGWHVFISTLAISLYTVSNTFILGFFVQPTLVGYYSAAESLIKAVQGLLNPVSQTIYPYISRISNQSKDQAILFIKKVTGYIGGITFIISLFIFIFAKPIVEIALGPEYSASITIIKILAFLPFLIALSNIFGIQTMLTFNYHKAFSNIILIASFGNIAISLFLVPILSYIGTAISVLSTEFVVTLSMYLYLNKKGINLLEVNYVRLRNSWSRVCGKCFSRKNS